MILNNMIAFKRALAFGVTDYTTLTSTPPKSINKGNGNIKLTTDDMRKILSLPTPVQYTYGNASPAKTGMWLGSDDTPVTENDYSIEAFTNSTELSLNSISATTPTISNGKIYATITASFTAVVDIIVKEVALTKVMYLSSVNDWAQFVIAREVFENTAAAGEPDSRTKTAGTTFTVSMTVEVD